MIDAGVLEDPKVDAAFGLHIDQDNPVGVIELRPGPAMAAADRFHMVIRGKGGHGAKPHDTVDPIVIGAQIVTALQTLVARVVDPTEEAHYETIRAAGFEPEDSAVKVGSLRAPWGDHPEGCLLVCYGSLSISRRVAISDRPASLKIH